MSTQTTHLGVTQGALRRRGCIHPPSPPVLGASGTRRGRGFHTLVEGALVDAWFGPTFVIENDGFRVNSKLEWIAHIVAHELVHCLLHCICKQPYGKDGGHGRDFVALNRLILGGRGHVWNPIFGR